MRAMILAAGRGDRLRPLTDTTPKPLVELAGKPLIEYHLENLSRAGYKHIVINLGHLGEQIPAALGNGKRWGINIHYSDEQPDALETGGGIVKALPLLGAAPFLVINGDIWTDYSYQRLRNIKCDYAHLVLVANPEHNHSGDFGLAAGRIANQAQTQYTFSGVSVFHPRLFSGQEIAKYSFVPLLRDTIDSALVTGELHHGDWFDIGTIDRLQELERHITGSQD